MPKPAASRVLAIAAALSGAAAGGGQPPRSVDVYVSHPLACLLDGEIKLRLSVYNRADARQTFRGVPVGAEGRLVLTGDWDLTIEQVREGKVVAARSLRPDARAEAETTELKPRGSKDWTWKARVGQIADRVGLYRFRVVLGGHRREGRLFRVQRTRERPDWIAVTYTPDKHSHFIGEPIAVHFVLRNTGSDELHFDEGGDYRGASRHLRWRFTAESADGHKAVDPKPDQPCFGGMGMSDPRLEPGETYEKDLPLLAYLKFPAPGTYTVKGYQGLGLDVPPEKPAPVSWRHSYGNSFQIALRLPTREQALAHLRSLLELERYERQRRFATLYHPCYLAPLGELLDAKLAAESNEALVTGVASVMTVAGTKRLIALAEDPRREVRVAALRAASWRLPDPRDTGKARPDGPFRFYSTAARRRDVEAAWDEALRPGLRALLGKGLKSEALDEVSASAYCLGALGDTDAVSLLAEAADRVAPTPAVSKERQQCAAQIASAACVLAQLGARPCKATRKSTPGRLAVWANMMRTKKEYRTGDWEDLILHMLGLESRVARMAAIRWLPSDFTRRDQIPWKALLLEEDPQIWWHAVQIARQTFPPDLEAATRAVLGQTQDKRKRGDLEALLHEMQARKRKNKQP